MSKTVVLGLGVSGAAAARFLAHRGVSVIGVDARLSLPEGKRFFSFLEALGVHLQSEEAPMDWASIGELIVSPGVSPRHPIYKEALDLGLPIRGEAELALPHLQKPLVGVTGTNGKTTVTLLVEHCLNAYGIRARALGNVGLALCDYLLNPGAEQVCVVELSSYQLETMRTPLFEAGVLLNITPDHLDRYSSLHSYAQAKCQLGSLVKSRADFLVQKRAANEYKELLDQPTLFGWESTCPLWTDGEAIFEGETVACLLPIAYKNKGKHDCENAMAGWALCRRFGVPGAFFAKALETFQKPSHRIEWVCEWEGVSYYDDSKGTNIDAVIQAVRSMPSEVVLIVGGVDKGASYLPWKDSFAGKVRHLVAIGQAAEKIEKELSSYLAVTRADSLEKAVNVAATLAQKGNCVLLSPGCSSFDMFRDYAHRGKEFQKYVKSLNEERRS